MTTITYPLDITGTSPLNLVSGEVHTPVMGNKAVFAIDAGNYYVSSLSVFGADGKAYNAPTDWHPALPAEVITGISKKLCCSLVVLTNPLIPLPVTISYQAPGDIHNFVAQKFVDTFYGLSLETNPVAWDIVFYDARKLPESFFANSAHQTDQGIQVGFEYLVRAIDRISETIMFGNMYAHELIRQYARDVITKHNADPDAHPQYLKVVDYRPMDTILRPKNVLPADAEKVLAGSLLRASPYYTLYGVQQKTAQFQVATDALFETIIMDVVKTSNFISTEVLAELPRDVDLYWRVRFTNTALDVSRWSVPTKFMSIDGKPLTPITFQLSGIGDITIPVNVKSVTIESSGGDGTTTVNPGQPYKPPSGEIGIVQYPSGLPVYVVGSAQFGLPEYPSGLLAYIAPRPQVGLPEYPSGLPSYVTATSGQAYAPAIYTWYEIPGSEQTAVENGTWTNGTIDSYNAYTHELPPPSIIRPTSLAATNEVFWTMHWAGDDTSNYLIVRMTYHSAIHTPEVPYVAPTPQIGNPTYPAGLPAYVAPYAGRGDVNHPGALPPYKAAVLPQGNSLYPAGLPVYQPASPGQAAIPPTTVTTTGANTTAHVNTLAYPNGYDAIMLGGIAVPTTPETQHVNLVGDVAVVINYNIAAGKIMKVTYLH